MSFIKKIVPFVLIVLTSCTITQRRYMPGFYVEKSSKKVKTQQNFAANNSRTVTTPVIETVPVKQNLSVPLALGIGAESPQRSEDLQRIARPLKCAKLCFRGNALIKEGIVSLQPIKVTEDDPKTLKKGRSKYAANRCFILGMLSFLMAVATILLLVLASGGANILSVFFILTSLAGVVFALFSIKNSQFVENAGESYTRSSIGLILAIVGGVVTGILLILSLISLLQAK
jgi:hypothetical protein